VVKEAKFASYRLTLMTSVDGVSCGLVVLQTSTGDCSSMQECRGKRFFFFLFGLLESPLSFVVRSLSRRSRGDPTDTHGSGGGGRGRAAG